jgi:hypothetical protein
VVARSHERIVSKVAADICLDHFAADSIARDEVFILTACHYGVLRGIVQMKRSSSGGYFNSDGPKEENRNYPGTVLKINPLGR